MLTSGGGFRPVHEKYPRFRIFNPHRGGTFPINSILAIEILDDSANRRAIYESRAHHLCTI